jgi:phosphoserine phosphatase
MLGYGCIGSAKGRSSTAQSAIESAQATSTTLPTKENTHISKSELSAAYSSVFFHGTIAHSGLRTISSKGMNISGAQAFYLTKHEFLESVLRLQAQVAAFDCDGTLWSGDAGVTFFDWEIENGVVPSKVGDTMLARYVEYKAGRVSEEDMCGEMVAMHAGMTEAALITAASDFMTRAFPGNIFAEMQELVGRLQANGCDVWAVSSSNEWIIRAGMKAFGIAEDRILAAKVEIENGVVTDRLVRVPSGPGKPKALQEVAKKQIDAAFGNSRWDADMLAMAKHGFAVNPNPDLESSARQNGWTIYFPDGMRG